MFSLLKKNPYIHSILKKIKWSYLSFRNIKFANRANSLIKESTTVHLMMNDKFIKPVVDFLNNNFSSGKNVFLCKRWFDYDFPEANNVIEVKTFAFINLTKCRKIICHSTFDEEVINLLYSKKDLLKKAFWIIWGGDLTENKFPLKKKKQFVFSNFSGYCGEHDEEFAKKNLNISPEIHFVSHLYPFPLNEKILRNVQPVKKDFIQIQLGQSIRESCLDSMDLIEKFKNENIKVCCILSYGGTENLKKLIIKKGKSIFGDKFFYIEKFMKPADYAKHVAENDVLVLNEKHQNAFGNTLAHLYLGKKVYIRSDIDTPKVLKKHGIITYATQDIDKLSFNDFINNLAVEQNKKNVLYYLSEDELVKQWKKIL